MTFSQGHSTTAMIQRAFRKRNQRGARGAIQARTGNPRRIAQRFSRSEKAPERGIFFCIVDEARATCAALEKVVAAGRRIIIFSIE